MEWLKDKKNLPIIAGVTGLVMAIAVVFLVLQMRKGSEAQVPPDVMPTATAPGPDYPAPGGPPGPSGGAAPTAAPAPTASPTPTGTPGQTGGPGASMTTGAGSAALRPLEKSRPDPFRPLESSKKVVVARPRLYVPSPGRLFPPKVEPAVIGSIEAQQTLPQPQRRMAGLLYNKRLYAILETDGESQVVKPGDITSDGKARVEIIEPDRIILKTLDDKKPETIEVKMAASNKPPEPTAASVMPGPTTPYPGAGPPGPYGPYGRDRTRGPRSPMRGGMEPMEM